MISPQSLHIDRIRSYLSGLEKGSYSRDARLQFWRLIISSAHDAFEAELRAMEELNMVVADPIITESFGGVVG